MTDPAPESCEKHYAWAIIAALGVLCTCMLLHQFRSQADYRIERSSLQLWMVEAMPGIGPKTSEKQFVALQARQDDSLPQRARLLLPQLIKLEE